MICADGIEIGVGVGEGKISCIIPLYIFSGCCMGKKIIAAPTAPKRKKNKKIIKSRKNFLFFNFVDRFFKTVNFTTAQFFSPKSKATIFLLGFILGTLTFFIFGPKEKVAIIENPKAEYWMILERANNKEYLYWGVPGDQSKSSIVRIFDVKTGMPNKRPTPLPKLLGKSYWKIVKKYPSYENPETSPYFLELDVPVEDGFFGPVPYKECNGEQCSWELPGYFGLHGVGSDPSKLSDENEGSSGCIRHSNEDITYLYNLLNVDEGVRYYVTM